MCSHSWPNVIDKCLFYHRVTLPNQLFHKLRVFQRIPVPDKNSRSLGVFKLAFHFFNQYRAEGKVKLFEGCEGYTNGGQLRDFVSIEDVVKVNMYLLDNPHISGIFNLGTGQAQSFNDVAVATVNTLRQAEGKDALALEQLLESGIISYIPFPDALRGKYQSYTQADIGALRGTGYGEPFLSVEQGVARYVGHMLKAAQA